MLFGTDQSLDVCYKRRIDRKLQMPSHMTPAFARFLGYFVSEGCILKGRTSDAIAISNNDPEVLGDLRRLSLEVLAGLPREFLDRNGVTTMRWNCSRLVELIEWLGIAPGAANKTIPDQILQGSYEVVSEFLRAYFEGDGSISNSFVSVASKSYRLIQQLQAVLLNMGIVCRLEYRDIAKYGRHYKLRIIGREGREQFARLVGFISTRKQSRLEAIIQRQVTHEHITLPFQRERLLRLYPNTKRDLKETIHACIRTKSRTIGLTYRRLHYILDHFPDRHDADYINLVEHQTRNLFYDAVAHIEQTSSQVFDLVVPQTHTYIANGFVSHNTTIFGIVYGISSFGLAQRTDLSRTEAQEMINGVFASYPGIRTYIDETLARGRDLGYVQSLFGRRRTMADLRASGPRRAAAEREAINAPIQGTAADIMKLAMIRVDRALRESGLQARLLLQVHDELIFECPEHEQQALATLVRTAMEGAFALRVPLTVEVESGQNWDEMH
jgi:DNA polymerase family A/LAGLIDADG-like domain